MGFSEELLDRAKPIREKISQHPFVRGLGDGTLAEERFRFYMEQDYLFLIEYSRVFALAAAKGPDLETMGRFAELLRSTLSVEMELHRSYAAEFGISRDDLERAPVAATTHAYTRHLLSVAWGGSIVEIAASLLPCQWGYWELGRDLAARAEAGQRGRYHRWIETYSAREFGELAEWLCALVNRLAEGRRPEELARTEREFMASSHYELMFWEMAWRRELWPA